MKNKKPGTLNITMLFDIVINEDLKDGIFEVYDWRPFK